MLGLLCEVDDFTVSSARIRQELVQTLILLCMRRLCLLALLLNGMKDLLGHLTVLQKARNCTSHAKIRASSER